MFKIVLEVFLNISDHFGSFRFFVIFQNGSLKRQKLIMLLTFERRECENQIRHIVFMHIHMAEVDIRCLCTCYVSSGRDLLSSDIQKYFPYFLKISLAKL